ncbi:MAG: G1 family endopeptidase [Thermoplasmata archaeon]|nr:G1 family endopeptidase [Thermoplasmata archaeon]
MGASGVLMLLVVSSLSLPLGSAGAAVSSTHLGLFHASSANWAGYAVKTTKGTVTDVQGSWIVPKVSCPSKGHLYSSFWVGIDGYGSSSVEQTGTDSDCNHGTPQYYAWFEFYPNPSRGTSLSIAVGDTMSADVSYSGGTFTTSITDVTTGKSYSASSTIKAARASAEWIAEAPSSFSGILPLANFGTAKFGFDSTNVSATCGATVSGTVHKLSGFSQLTPLTMVSRKGATKASPSSVSSDGTSFSVTWASSGP